MFSDSEKEVLELIAHESKDGGKKLLQLSHEEAAYRKTNSLELISYEFAKELKI